MPNRRRPDDPASVAEPITPRLQALVDEVSQRLRPVCSQMPATDFDLMVLQIARATYRWEQRTAKRGGRDP